MLLVNTLFLLFKKSPLIFPSFLHDVFKIFHAGPIIEEIKIYEVFGLPGLLSVYSNQLLP